MVVLAPLADALGGTGLGTARLPGRKSLRGREHEFIDLPPALIAVDGRLRIYPEVLKRLNPRFEDGVPKIQLQGWVGYLPISDEYAIEVEPRVPLDNLERMVSMAAGYSPEVVRAYARLFGQSEERPGTLIDLIADQLLSAFDQAWSEGLLKTYRQVVSAGASPAGRIMPFQTALQSARAGRPVAVSQSFQRSIDWGPNRVLRLAIEKLLIRSAGEPGRTAADLSERLRAALARLEGISTPSLSEIAPEAIARYVRDLPFSHLAYADALMMAQLVVHDMGLAIRGGGSVALLPSILINTALAFEDYIRRVLATGLADVGLLVLDGNKGRPSGAREDLYSEFNAVGENPPAQPDIVIQSGAATGLVIDVKYNTSSL